MALFEWAGFHQPNSAWPLPHFYWLSIFTSLRSMGVTSSSQYPVLCRTEEPQLGENHHCMMTTVAWHLTMGKWLTPNWARREKKLVGLLNRCRVESCLTHPLKDDWHQRPSLQLRPGSILQSHAILLLRCIFASKLIKASTAGETIFPCSILVAGLDNHFIIITLSTYKAASVFKALHVYSLAVILTTNLYSRWALLPL